MPPVTATQSRELPAWAVAACIAAVVIIVGYVGYSVLTGRGNNPGPSIEVRPGMYDIRAEAAKAAGNGAARTGGGGDGK